MSVFFIFAFAVGIAAYFWYKRKKILENIREMKYVSPKSIEQIQEDAASITASIGERNYTEYVEIRGVIGYSPTPLQACISQIPCLYYKTEITHEYETPKKKKTKEGELIEWEEKIDFITSIERQIPFMVKDHHGHSIQIDPSGAKIYATLVKNEFKTGIFEPITQQFFESTFEKRTIGFRYEEEIIPNEQILYILGEANTRNGVLQISQTTDAKYPFIISVQSKEELIPKKEKEASDNLIISILSLSIGTGFVVYELLKYFEIIKK